jgi:PncC family amidohydrolase
MTLEELAADFIRYAEAHRRTVCTAESCSAGRLAQAFSKAEGASRFFLGGIIAYTKEMKTRMLGVPPGVIEAGTAVCGLVAEAMAHGAIIRSGADLAVAITGVAGPEPDEDKNPVGLVYCAVASKDGRAKHVKCVCKGNAPDGIIDEACRRALKLLREFSAA